MAEAIQVPPIRVEDVQSGVIQAPIPPSDLDLGKYFSSGSTYRLPNYDSINLSLSQADQTIQYTKNLVKAYSNPNSIQNQVQRGVKQGLSLVKYGVTEPFYQLGKNIDDYREAYPYPENVEQLGIGSEYLGIGPEEQKAVYDLGIGTASSSLKYPKEKPKEALISYSLGLAFRPAGALLGAGLNKLKIPSLWSKVPNILRTPTEYGVKGALPGLYAYEKGSRVIAEPDYYEKGRILGEVPAELNILKAGADTEARISQKVISFFSPGSVYIPRSEIVDPQRLKGKTFPEVPDLSYSSAKLLEREIKSGKFRPSVLGSEPIVWKGAESPFARVTETKTGPYELPGAYVSPGLSEYFLRAGQPVKTSYNPFGTFFGKYPRPTALAITPKQIQIVSKRLGFKDWRSMSKAEKQALINYLKYEAPKGSAQIPLIKTEKELLIPPETKLIGQDIKFFTRTKEGIKVPIQQFTAEGTSSSLVPNKNVKTYSSILSSYSGSGKTTIPLISGSYFTPSKSSYNLIPTSRSEKKQGISSFPVSERGSRTRVSSRPTSYFRGSSSYYIPPIYIPGSPSIPLSYRGSSRKRPPYRPGYYPGSSTYRTPGEPPERPSFFFQSPRSKKKKELPGFIPFTKKGGKWIAISRTPLPKGRALKLGAKKVRETLRASFFLKPAGKTSLTDIAFKPDPRIFRKPIRKGKEIQSPIFIQKAGTKRESPTIKTARLTSPGEKAEIKRNRRNKIKW